MKVKTENEKRIGKRYVTSLPSVCKAVVKNEKHTPSLMLASEIPVCAQGTEEEGKQRTTLLYTSFFK